MLKTQLFLVFCACLLSACYDTVVDGHRISSVNPQNQGYITSLFIAGYRVSWLFAGGLGLMFADHYGWSNLYLMMACFYGTVFVLTVIMRLPIQTLPDQSTPIKTKQPNQDNIFKHCLQWLQTPSVICAISIALMINCHMAIIKPVITVFLLNGLKMGLSEIGIWYKSVGFIATLAGGFFTSRYLRTTIDSSAIHICMASQIVCGFCFFLTSLYTDEHWLSVLCIISECFSMGISSTVMVIILAQSCQTALAGTQYALLTSFCALERILVVPMVGSIPDYYGWPQFWLTTLGITSMAWLGSFMTQVIYKNRTFSESDVDAMTTTQA
jgi:PAT family beta-lactamase induction signal transducer AmpG